MSGTDTQLWCAVAAGCILAAVIFHRWLAALLKLLLRTLLGSGALAVLSLCSGITGLTLGVNPLNALVLGILGAPGLALLCALNVLTG